MIKQLTLGQYIRTQRSVLKLTTQDVIAQMPEPIGAASFSQIENDHIKNPGFNNVLSILKVLKDAGADPIDIYAIKQWSARSVPLMAE